MLISKTIKVASILCFICLLATCTTKVSRCSNLKIPQQISQETLNQILKVIPKKKAGQLESITFKSWKVDDFGELPNGRLSRGKVASEYGIHLFFSDGQCGGGHGFIIIKQNNKFIIDQEYIALCPRSHTPPCSIGNN